MANNHRRLLLLIACVFVFRVEPVETQQPAASVSRLAWDQAAPDLASAQGYTYRYYPDGAANGTVLGGVTCTGTIAPFICVAPFPAFTPGPHSLTLTAANLAGESVPSAPLSFVFVVTPAAPTNVRIQ